LGRITHYVDPNLNEEAKTQKLEELANDDPEVDRLKGLNEDKRMLGMRILEGGIINYS